MSTIHCNALYVTFCYSVCNTFCNVLHLFHILTFAFCNSIYECAKECAQLARWTDVHNAHHCNPVEFAPVTFCNDLNTSDCAISHFATLQSSSVHTNMMLLVEY